jgi:SHS2 domain-containing protein
MSAIITDLSLIEPRDKVAINCEEPDLELLFADWLNALIYEMSTRKMLFSQFEVTIEGSHLAATIWGEKIDVKRHQPAVEIKGATYTELAVNEIQNQWLAQCVVDV